MQKKSLPRNCGNYSKGKQEIKFGRMKFERMSLIKSQILAGVIYSPDKIRSIVKYNYKDHALKTFELENPRQQLFKRLKVDTLFFISTNVSFELWVF